MEEHTTPETTEKPAVAASSTPHTGLRGRIGNLKTYFLYVLIVGLGLAALTSVIALLIGEFTAVIGKTLLTILSLFIHSLLLLAIMWADTDNRIGKALVPTTLFVTLFASLVTTTLGVWGILSSQTVGYWMSLYFLALGGAYIITALQALRSKSHAVQISSNVSIGFVAATLIALVPFVLHVVEHFDPLYFRIIGALSILSSASFLISLILRSIAKSKGQSDSKKTVQQMPGGMLAIYIITGVITAISWNVGLASLIVSGADANRSHYHETRYN